MKLEIEAERRGRGRKRKKCIKFHWRERVYIDIFKKKYWSHLGEKYSNKI